MIFSGLNFSTVNSRKIFDKARYQLLEKYLQSRKHSIMALNTKKESPSLPLSPKSEFLNWERGLISLPVTCVKDMEYSGELKRVPQKTSSLLYNEKIQGYHYYIFYGRGLEDIKPLNQYLINRTVVKYDVTSVHSK